MVTAPVYRTIAIGLLLYVGLCLVWWSLDSGPWSMTPRDILTEKSPYGAVRVFGDDSSLNHTELAEQTVDVLEDVGGLTRSIVVVALPTGSGWVDPHQVEALEQWADGDIATVSMRYSHAPSAAVFLLNPQLAKKSAHELLRTVVARVEELPADQRPEIIVHGQSLGAIAGEAAIAAQNEPESIAVSLWQGMPGGNCGADDDSGCSVSVINPDDPVAQLTPAILADPVNLWNVVSALPAAASAEPGSGHSYAPVFPPAHCVSTPA